CQIFRSRVAQEDALTTTLNSLNFTVICVLAYNSLRSFNLSSYVLEYIFGEPEEEWMIRQCVDYLLSIALNHEIYYYRCSDFIGLVNPEHPVIDIEIDKLFVEEYAPSIGASREEKYRIQKLLVK
ncbi:MAG: hypothetical protein J0L70_24690, partial [Leptolyngbya sp. UWPOB_LEPTO1]|uniref:hypothetical protein n=1 Tax=Leptolyngbya sp. UWPOB_LEPTO1 TaxID=2815653 RepID=UPI001AC73210